MRPSYRRDRDRIVHSSAFRRLEYKTQVFLYREDDHYRTRLTHTLEVSQVARSVALALGLNESFVEALALAHDLGHPPFGHAGEDALRRCMKDAGGFEHNVQALRVVDSLERRYPTFPGLNLTHEIRESLLKHRGLGEKDDQGSESSPWLEAQLVDVADSIAYNHHDLDDGLRSGFLDVDELEELDIWCEARAHFLIANPKAMGKELNNGVLNRLLSMSIGDLIHTSSERLERVQPRSANEARSHDSHIVMFSETMKERQVSLGRFLFRRLYRSGRVAVSREEAIGAVERLFNYYMENPESIGVFYRGLIEGQGRERAVADFIAGMTDRYAEREHVKCFGKPPLSST